MTLAKTHTCEATCLRCDDDKQAAHDEHARWMSGAKELSDKRRAAHEETMTELERLYGHALLIEVERDALRARVAELEAEVSRLRGGLKREVTGNATEWSDTQWAPAGMLEEREALRRKFEEVTAQLATARADAAVLVHAYDHDTRPPADVLARSRALKDEP